MSNLLGTLAAVNMELIPTEIGQSAGMSNDGGGQIGNDSLGWIRSGTASKMTLGNNDMMDQKPVDLALRHPFKQEINSSDAIPNFQFGASNGGFSNSGFNSASKIVDNGGGKIFRGTRRPFNGNRSSRGRGYYQQNRGGQHYQSQVGNYGNNSHMGSFDNQFPHYYQQQQFYPPHLMAYTPNLHGVNPYSYSPQFNMGQFHYQQQQQQHHHHHQMPLQNVDHQHVMPANTNYCQTDMIHYSNDLQGHLGVSSPSGVVYYGDPSLQYAQGYSVQHPFYQVPPVPQYAPMNYHVPQQQSPPLMKPAQQHLLDSVESMFSPINLSANERLRQSMDFEGFVPLITVQSLSKIPEMGRDITYLSQTLGQSQTLELSPDGLKVRPRKDWHIWKQTSNAIKEPAVKVGNEDVSKAKAVSPSKSSSGLQLSVGDANQLAAQSDDLKQPAVEVKGEDVLEMRVTQLGVVQPSKSSPGLQVSVEDAIQLAVQSDDVNEPAVKKDNEDVSEMKTICGDKAGPKEEIEENEKSKEDEAVAEGSQSGEDEWQEQRPAKHKAPSLDKSSVQYHLNAGRTPLKSNNVRGGGTSRFGSRPRLNSRNPAR